jgi:hypothetical protein
MNLIKKIILHPTAEETPKPIPLENRWVEAITFLSQRTIYPQEEIKSFWVDIIFMMGETHSFEEMLQQAAKLLILCSQIGIAPSVYTKTLKLYMYTDKMLGLSNDEEPRKIQ